MVINMVMFVTMTTMANVADLKSRMSKYLRLVEKGGEVVVCKRNVPLAKITSLRPMRKNTSVPGRGKGKIKILGDITGPIIPESDWNMLNKDFDPA